MLDSRLRWYITLLAIYYYWGTHYDRDPGSNPGRLALNCIMLIETTHLTQVE